MILAEIRKDPCGEIRGFMLARHAGSRACAAVSMLAINTVNSIETFLDDDIMYEYDPDEGGYIRFSLSGRPSEGASVLLKALELGLESVLKSYPDEIRIEVKTEVKTEGEIKPASEGCESDD